MYRRFYWGPKGEHSPDNLSYINDSRLTSLADKQLKQLKSDERKQTWREVEPIMAEEQYWIVLSTTTQSWFWDPALKNSWMPSTQGSQRYMMKWWLDKS